MSMIMTVTNAIVSKGYEDQPAIRFNEKGDFARFRFGCSKYDKNAPNNKRWINMSAKAFDSICERIKKMQLKEGSHVTLIGEYDEEIWTDDNTNEQKSAPSLTLLFIEYASAAVAKQTSGAVQAAALPANDGGQPSSPAEPSVPEGQRNSVQQKMPDSFEGYQSFDAGTNPYYPEQT